MIPRGGCESGCPLFAALRFERNVNYRVGYYKLVCWIFYGETGAGLVY